MLAATFGTGQVAYSILWFALFFVELWLMFSVFVDIFRSHDLPGWAKALWVLFVLLVPLLGILAYFIVRGNKLRAHQIEARGGWSGGGGGAAGGWGGAPPAGPRSSTTRSAHDVVESLHRLADLRDRGELTADQYRRLRAELLDEEEP